MAEKRNTANLFLQALGDSLTGNPTLLKEKANERQNRQALDLFKEKLQLETEAKGDPFTQAFQKKAGQLKAEKEFGLGQQLVLNQETGLFEDNLGNQFQRDEFKNGEFTFKKVQSLKEKEQALLEEAQLAATKKFGNEFGKSLAKKEGFKQSVEAFETLENKIIDVLPEGGFGNRISKGMELTISALDQSTELGQVAAAYKAAKLRFRTQLARQVDVGNLTRNEQEAAEQLLTTFFDSKNTAKIKQDLRHKFNQAATLGDGEAMKKIIGQIQEQEFFEESVQGSNLADSILGIDQDLSGIDLETDSKVNSLLDELGA